MLLPKYTVRRLLAITTLCALVAAVVSLARQGETWAMAVSLAIGSLVLAALLYMLLFALASIGALVTSPLSSRRIARGPQPSPREPVERT